MAQTRFVLRALLIAACASCAPRTEIDVARAMCAQNIACGNFSEDLEGCTSRVSQTMPVASCSRDELMKCEADISAGACTFPEQRLPDSCGVCE